MKERARSIKHYGLILGLAVFLMLLAVIPVSAAPRLSRTKLSLAVGQSFTLQVKGAGSKKVKWQNTAKTIAVVSSKGVVKAKNPGTAMVRAKVGKSTLSCTVQVFPRAMQKADFTFKGEAVMEQYRSSSVQFVDTNSSKDTAMFCAFCDGSDEKYLTTYRGISPGSSVSLVKAAYGKGTVRNYSLAADKLYVILSKNPGNAGAIDELRKMKYYLDYTYTSHTLRFYFNSSKKVGVVAAFKNISKIS